jgi:hypothetical protein
MRHIRKFNENQSGEVDLEDLRDYFSDLEDLFDSEMKIYTKSGYLNSDDVKGGNVNGNIYSYLKDYDYLIITRIKSYPSSFTGRSVYSLSGAIESSKYNHDLLSLIKSKLDNTKLIDEYEFYLKDSYKCYFFFNVI